MIKQLQMENAPYSLQAFITMRMVSIKWSRSTVRDGELGEYHFMIAGYNHKTYGPWRTSFDSIGVHIST